MKKLLSTLLALAMMAYQLFSEALDHLMNTKAPLHQLTQEALDMLHYQFAQPLTLAGVARRLHISSEHLRCVFQQDMQISFSEYLLKVRMDEACRLLRESSFCVAEIAKRTGFPDAAYFHRIFHKHVGMTPKQYRMGCTQTGELTKGG